MGRGGGPPCGLWLSLPSLTLRLTHARRFLFGGDTVPPPGPRTAWPSWGGCGTRLVPAQETPLKLNLARSQGHGAGRAPQAWLAPGGAARTRGGLPVPGMAGAEPPGPNNVLDNDAGHPLGMLHPAPHGPPPRELSGASRTPPGDPVFCPPPPGLLSAAARGHRSACAPGSADSAAAGPAFRWERSEEQRGKKTTAAARGLRGGNVLSCRLQTAGAARGPFPASTPGAEPLAGTGTPRGRCQRGDACLSFPVWARGLPWGGPRGGAGLGLTCISFMFMTVGGGRKVPRR